MNGLNSAAADFTQTQTQKIQLQVNRNKNIFKAWTKILTIAALFTAAIAYCRSNENPDESHFFAKSFHWLSWGATTVSGIYTLFFLWAFMAAQRELHRVQEIPDLANRVTTELAKSE